MEEKKTYILDTNVLLHNPQSLFFFAENDVVIPDVVLDELDKHKGDKGEVGMNSRQVARTLSKMLKDPKNGDLINGYKTNAGGTIRIEQNCHDVIMPENWEHTPDFRILRVCKGLTEKSEKIPKNKRQNVVLVSNDSYMRVKATVLGIKAEEFYGENTKNESDLYSGRLIGLTTSAVIDSIYSQKHLKKSELKKVDFSDAVNGDSVELKELVKNEYILLCNKKTKSQSALCYFDGETIVLCEDSSNMKASEIIPRNVGQKFMLHALRKDPKELPLVTVLGGAGTGKTLIAIASALQQQKENKYTRIYYLRSAKTEKSEEIGFLPGSETEKLDPFTRPAKDSLEVICKLQNKNKKDKKSISPKDIEKEVQKYFDNGIIVCESLSYIRGRTLRNSIIIVDEIQNTAPNMVKTILSRVSEDSKIILMGDIQQIDDPYLDKLTNGLSYTVNKMKGSPLASVITMLDEECERSPLSYEIIKRMTK